jgi:cytochrome bd ubiquinol oxidase subunit II
VLAAHGASFLAFRGTGELAERARRWARRLWIGEALLFVAMIGPTYAVRDEMLTNLTDHPWRLVFPLLAIAALGAMFVLQRAREWARAFVASSVFIVGLLTAGLYPNLVAAREGNPHSLTVDNAAAGSTHAQGGAHLVVPRHGARRRVLRLRLQGCSSALRGSRSSGPTKACDPRRGSPTDQG